MIHRASHISLLCGLCAAAWISVALFPGVSRAQEVSKETSAAQPPLPAPDGPPSDVDTLTVLGLRPMETLRFVNPQLNSADVANAKEAWIHLRVTVSATGDVTDARLVQAFPKNSYEKAVLKVAPGWRFQPPMKNGKPVDGSTFDVGVAIYSDKYESQKNDSFRSASLRSVSRYNYTTLDNLIKDLTGTADLNAAGPRLEKLKKRYEDGDMTITDIARYYAAMARYERLRGHYNVSLAASHGALMLSRFLDNRKMIYGLHLEIMSSLLSMGRNDDALDYFDRWKLVTKIQMSKEGVQVMEDLRAAGAGKGHEYTIIDFDAAHRYERKHTVGVRRLTTIPNFAGGGGLGTPPPIEAEIEQASLQTSLELISIDFPDILDPGVIIRTADGAPLPPGTKQPN